MNRKTVFLVIGILAVIASIAMYKMKSSSHLTELENFWWIPLPLAFVCFMVSASGKKAA